MRESQGGGSVNMPMAQIGTDPGPQRELSVPAALAGLEQEIQMVTNAVESLTERLRPVLRPSPATKTPGMGAIPTPAVAALTSRIQESKSKLCALHEVVAGLLNDLEI